MARWLVGAALVLGSVGCIPRRVPAGSTAPQAASSVGELLTFERTSCYGQCPTYKVVLFKDGRLRYEGSIAVADPGPAEARLAPSAMAAVRSNLQRASELQSDCCDCSDWTDSPSVEMSFALPDGGTKRIYHYHGCEKAPDWLYDVENSIDAALGTEKWVGSKVEYKAYHPR
jgi:hypothetical protein